MWKLPGLDTSTFTIFTIKCYGTAFSEYISTSHTCKQWHSRQLLILGAHCLSVANKSDKGGVCTAIQARLLWNS